MSEPIFRNWTSEVTANWGKTPLSLQHRLHERPLFTLEELEQLIETYPREHYVAMYANEVGIKYDPFYEKGATEYVLEPGTMMYRPLYTPHRGENLDCLNISMTTEYWTENIRRRQLVNMAGGLLCSKLGITPKSTATSGAGFWAKAALQAAVRRAGLLKKEQQAKRPIEFKLDSVRPGAIIDLAAAAE